MRRLSFLTSLAIVAALPLFGRSIHWQAVDVDAHLRADGRLHVRERQVIVFDGDWNGGERVFRLKDQQSLGVNSILRIENGVETPVVHGDLAQVDRWRHGDTDEVIRWRSRKPDDPPFENRAITYVLDVTYSNILVPMEDGRYMLDHDFSMSERPEGTIERFTLDVTFDPVWSGVTPVSMAYENMQPGEKAIVTRTFSHTGPAPPSGVAQRLPPWQGWLAIAIFVAAVGFLAAGFIARERAIGRFAPIESKLDDAVLGLRPEVAGAAWDRGVGPAEVSAVLARLTQEQKIESRVEKKTLYMRLLVERKTLTGYERDLVAALFVNGDSTDTKKIRKYYEHRGFNPAERIRPGVETHLFAIPEWTGEDPVIDSRKQKWALAITGVLLLGSLFFAMNEAELGLMFLSLIAGVLFGGIAAGTAVRRSKNVTAGPARLLLPNLILIAAAASPFLIGALNVHPWQVHWPLLVTQILWATAWAWLALTLLRNRDSREKVAFRKRVAGVRRAFIEELSGPAPALRDEWYPHLLAFGLGRNADRWFRAHATNAGRSDDRSWSSSSSSWTSSSGGSSSSSSWTGGGGAFGGAGASMSWTVAAAGIASGVAPPSSSGSGGSSSSGSSGGGSSSSGGGGGGGW